MLQIAHPEVLATLSLIIEENNRIPPTREEVLTLIGSCLSCPPIDPDKVFDAWLHAGNIRAVEGQRYSVDIILKQKVLEGLIQPVMNASERHDWIMNNAGMASW